ncbi:MAG: DUF2330 domain-containing protein [Myxococcota bacterium]
MLRFHYSLAAMAVLFMLKPVTASACGGFFCNNSAPVNQAAERILFHVGADGTVTAVIQIQYEGPSESFAWVLPVSGTPEVAVSSDQIFTRLQNATNPQYTVVRTIEGDCDDDARTFAGGADSGTAFEGDENGAPGVNVEASGSVGPYDFAVISVDPALTNAADVAIEWLSDEGYDLSAITGDVLGPYLESGLNLIAFRLTKGSEADAGSIRPIMLTFGQGLPSIPLRPTAVAADPNMGVLVWTLGPARAIPVNYRSLELNEALINWLNPGPTYNAVVTAAADEAGGQGFVTEMAGSVRDVADAVFPGIETAALEQARGQAGSDADNASIVSELLAALAGADGLLDAVESSIPLAEGVSAGDLVGCPFCTSDFIDQSADFDLDAFLNEVEVRVVAPVEDTATLFEEQLYLTRLYTTMSPADMTLDPSFDFNAELGDYSNLHTATQFIECGPGVSQFDASWRMDIPGADTIRGVGAQWPFDISSSDQPANARILRVGTTGNGEVIEDNTAVIQQAVSEHNQDVGPTGSLSGGGCSVVHSSQDATTLGALIAFAVWFARRRRFHKA